MYGRDLFIAVFEMSKLLNQKTLKKPKRIDWEEKTLFCEKGQKITCFWQKDIKEEITKPLKIFRLGTFEGNKDVFLRNRAKLTDEEFKLNKGKLPNSEIYWESINKPRFKVFICTSGENSKRRKLYSCFLLFSQLLAYETAKELYEISDIVITLGSQEGLTFNMMVFRSQHSTWWKK